MVLDGSTDGSAARSAGSTCLICFGSSKEPNRGLAVSRNSGARAARHLLAVFRDDDIEPSP